jgi:D-alanyl-D-alanine dipeptidase
MIAPGSLDLLRNLLRNLVRNLVAPRIAVALATVALAACASGPPRESGDLLAPDLVAVTSVDPTIRLDVRYATADNFVGRPVYPPHPRVLLQRPAAAALGRASATLREQGFGLIVFDAYRPWSVTRLFWKVTPPAQRDYVADPRKGSRHNRGCAVDLTLYELASGEPVPMPSAYDDFSERAHPDFAGGTAEQRRHRDLLRAAMEAEGFTVYSHEWWHFDYQGWERYPILDLPVGPAVALPPAPGAVSRR